MASLPPTMEEVAEYVDDPGSGWLVKREEHAYCAADSGIKVSDVSTLLVGPELSSNADLSQHPTSDDTQRVTMYQCAQCKMTFESLEKCVGHQCSTGESSLFTAAAPSEPALQALDAQSLNYRWGLPDTEALMYLLSANVDKFSNPDLKRKFLWKEINDQMIDKGYVTTQLQCENRWKTLKAMYRKSQMSGSTPPFYTEMCEIAEKYPVLMSDAPPCAVDRVEKTGQRSWPRQTSLTLLSLVKARHKDLSDRSIKRRAFWDGVARSMKELGMEYSSDQCEGRFKTLLYAYKRVQARFETTGEQSESDCFCQVEEIVRLVPELTAPPRAAPSPRATAGRRRRSAVGATAPRLRRQRDLLLWLEQWLQEQRRWDDAMLAALQQQHVERQRTMQLVLEEVRSGRCRVPVSRPVQTNSDPAPPLPPASTTSALGDAANTLVAQVFIN